MGKNVRYYNGKKYIRYKWGWIDPEDHGGLSGKPTIYRFRRKRKKKYGKNNYLKYTKRHLTPSYKYHLHNIKHHIGRQYTLTETIRWKLKNFWRKSRGIFIFILILLIIFYVYKNQEYIDKASSLFNETNTTSVIVTKPTINYTIGPKNETLNYVLRGKKGSVDYQVYKGLNDYLKYLPRYYYCEPACPSLEELNLRFINNDKQREFLLPLVEKIRQESENNDDRVRIAVSLIQQILYDTASMNKDTDERYPYQVLYDNKGLCGEKSKLLAFILKELGYGVVLFDFEQEQHQSVGIKCPQSYSLLDTGYCFIESTSPTIITYLPTEYFGVGELKTTPKISKVSDGKSFNSVSEEYDDMATLKAIESLGLVISQEDYRIWKKLEWKYDLIETEYLE